MLEGIKHSRPKVNDARLSITKDLLMAIIRFLPFVCNSNYEIGLFQTAFSVAYHGLLRIGEIAHSGCHSRHVIRISDVFFIEWSFASQSCFLQKLPIRHRLFDFATATTKSRNLSLRVNALLFGRATSVTWPSILSL